MKRHSLDDLYRMTAYIYSEQNAIRPVSATLAHFVEVCGMLTSHDRSKKKEGLSFVDALCKALGWYFPLLAKLRVRSVEELVFRKFPLVCPYCRKAPHVDIVCKTVRGTASTVNHTALRRIHDQNKNSRPVDLDEWQQMFQDIYPRSLEERGRSSLGLFEELGELAEAVRVFERYPRYFVGEAADTFSYLMGLANEYSLRSAQEDIAAAFSFQAEYLKRYPGLCVGCGHRVCICPSIPSSTVGRMSKELEIAQGEELFDSSAEDMISEGHRASSKVLESLGGYRTLAERIPADRGDANTALVVLFLKLASAVEGSQPELADRFHRAAVELSSSVSDAGTRLNQNYLATHEDLLFALREAWRTLQGNEAAKEMSLEESSLAFKIGSALGRLRVLVVHASPADQDQLRVSGEVRAIKEAVQLAGRGVDIEIDDLPAATIDDLRRKLLSNEYEIVHFAGHADSESIVLEEANGSSFAVPIDALAELMLRQRAVRCVVLNGCASLAAMTRAMAPFTVGMEASVDDQAAIEFARGFYDAIARGKTFEFAVSEGESAAKLKGLSCPPVKLIKQSNA